MNMREISEQTGICLNTLHARKRRGLPLDMPVTKPKLSDEDVALIRALLPFLSNAEIARKFDVHKEAVRSIRLGKRKT